MTQERVNVFADATDDHQWIHVDPERAKEGPFGVAIAHGYLTLSLAPVLLNKVIPVSYTHLDVYKRQQWHIGENLEEQGRVARADRGDGHDVAEDYGQAQGKGEALHLVLALGQGSRGGVHPTVERCV